MKKNRLNRPCILFVSKWATPNIYIYKCVNDVSTQYANGAGGISQLIDVIQCEWTWHHWSFLLWKFNLFLLFMWVSSYSVFRGNSVLYHTTQSRCKCELFDLSWVDPADAIETGFSAKTWSLWAVRRIHTETLSYHIILWTDFSPLSVDLSLSCQGCSQPLPVGGLWQICRALGDNSWSLRYITLRKGGVKGTYGFCFHWYLVWHRASLIALVLQFPNFFFR